MANKWTDNEEMNEFGTSSVAMNDNDDDKEHYDDNNGINYVVNATITANANNLT